MATAVPEPTPASSGPLKPSRPATPTEREADPLSGEFLPAPRSASPRSAFRRTALFVLGLLMVVAGIVLGVLPVVPGFPLTIAVLLMMAAGSSVTRSLLNHAEMKLPRRVRLVLRGVLRRCMEPRRVP